MGFELVTKLEDKVASFFGAPYAIATDSCTHGVELCLRYEQPYEVTFPTHTYPSVPFLGEKLGLRWEFREEEWVDYYQIGNTNVYDAAVLWKMGGYIPGTHMCLSFQYQKHLKIGRGGMILTDNKEAYEMLSEMVYDGRNSRDIPWRQQNIKTVGYHYYMTPEAAQIGLDQFEEAVLKTPKIWTDLDYPDLRTMDVFK
jgi:dTDP-4-amino-4,6-dideoxygalactose transaminase